VLKYRPVVQKEKYDRKIKSLLYTPHYKKKRHFPDNITIIVQWAGLSLQSNLLEKSIYRVVIGVKMPMMSANVSKLIINMTRLKHSAASFFTK
jgi:hypothetical protein